MNADLIADARKQSERRWQAVVLRADNGMETVWRSDRLHFTRTAAMHEAKQQRRKMEQSA